MKKLLLVLIALPLLFSCGDSLTFMGTEVTKPTSWQEFNQKMLQKQKVEKVVLVNQKTAEIYIKEECLSDDIFKEVSKKKFGNGNNPGPHYYFEIGSVETFENNFKEAQSFHLIENETRNDVFGDILSWVLPLVLFISLLSIYPPLAIGLLQLALNIS